MKQIPLLLFLFFTLRSVAQVSSGTVHVQKNNIPALDTIRLLHPGEDTMRYYWKDDYRNTPTQYRIVNGDTLYQTFSSAFLERAADCRPCLVQWVNPADSIFFEFEAYGTITPKDSIWSWCYCGVYVDVNRAYTIDEYGTFYGLPNGSNTKNCSLKNGIWKEYGKNGILLRDEFWTMNKLDSVFVYHVDPKAKNSGEVNEGKWFYYNPDGSLNHIESWSDGEKNGEWKYFDKKGKLTQSQTWKKGKRVK